MKSTNNHIKCTYSIYVLFRVRKLVSAYSVTCFFMLYIEISHECALTFHALEHTSFIRGEYARFVLTIHLSYVFAALFAIQPPKES